jgi:predicted DNA-binding WGR domain protein
MTDVRHPHAYLEYVGGTSRKFYRAVLLERPDGSWSAETGWGRIGNHGVSARPAEGVARDAAVGALAEVIDAKRRKGYRDAADPDRYSAPLPPLTPLFTRRARLDGGAAELSGYRSADEQIVVTAVLPTDLARLGYAPAAAAALLSAAVAAIDPEDPQAVGLRLIVAEPGSPALFEMPLDFVAGPLRSRARLDHRPWLAVSPRALTRAIAAGAATA